MVIREYGTKNQRNLLFFSSTAEQYTDFLEAVSLLSQKFHVFLFTPDGHDLLVKDDFISIEKSVDEAVRWLKEKHIDSLYAVYGLSMGGAMAMRMTALEEIPIEKAIIDGGTAPYQYPQWICRLIACRDFLIFRSVYHSRRLLELAAPTDKYTPIGKDPKEVYDESFRYLQSYTNKTIWNVFWSANNYSMPSPPPDVTTKMQFWYGSEERKNRKRDLQWAEDYFPKISVKVIPGMDHGQLVMIYPELFYTLAMEFLED